MADQNEKTKPARPRDRVRDALAQISKRVRERTGKRLTFRPADEHRPRAPGRRKKKPAAENPSATPRPDPAPDAE